MIRRALALAAACCGLLAAEAAAAAMASAGLEVDDGGVRLQVMVITDEVLRVRIAAAESWPEDASWAVPAELRQRSKPIAAITHRGVTEFHTTSLKVSITTAPLRLVVSDRDGRVISADAPVRAVTQEGSGFLLRKVLPPTEHYFGLGDKAGPLDHRGQSFTNWNSDAYHFQESTDPLYKTIPFFIAAGGPGGSYGILLDNTWRSSFDFGKQDPQTLSFGAAGGPIDYYLIQGPSIPQVMQRYTQLTGRAPLPPAWAFGFQQSRYSYLSATEVEAIAARLRLEHIPADVIWLDIDYQDRNRPFTVNPHTFPDIAGMAKRLHDQNFRLVAITDLHIAAAPGESYHPYDSGIAGDHFIARENGSRYVGEVWPGPAVFPEFTRSTTRDWWGTLYRDFVAAGIAGFWNDMNEPSVFVTPDKTMPLDNRHRIEDSAFAPRVASHAEIHNVYGMLNSKATFEGLQRLTPNERPFVMTRASYAGGQRYAATWTGDNSSTWNHLKLATPMLLNLGLSGFAYSGTDVGGFIGAPSADLLTRWTQIAAFTPIFRAHSAKDTPAKEPWVDGPEHTAIRRHYIEERYRLLPYVAALADENARSGAPLMRPVFYEFPEMLQADCDQSAEFLLGDQLLVAPSPDLESPGAYLACLPRGGWFDYWSGSPVSAETARIVPTLDRLPVYVRAGAILPSQPLVQSTAELPRGALILDVYPGADCRGTLYADDGHSLGYLRGEYLRQPVSCQVMHDGMDIRFGDREGRFTPWWRTLQVRVHGWSGPARGRLNGKPMALPVGGPAQLSVTIDDPVRAVTLALRHYRSR